MAELLKSSSPAPDEFIQGHEPGAKGGGIFIATDSYEELTKSLDGVVLDESRQRNDSKIIQLSRNGSSHSSSKPKENEDEHKSHQTELEGSQESGDSKSSQQSDYENNEGNTSESEPKTRSVSEGDDMDVDSATWRLQKKHVFILSEAGKPIYSRYGKEDKLVTIMGVMQAIVSFVQCSHDNIKCVIAGNHQYVFLVREHLILVCAARTYESTQQILLQLSYLYNQIVSVLTLSQMSRIFKQRRNYDLRRLLTGSEKFMDNLLNLMDSEPSFLLSSVRCLPLASAVRDLIAQTVVQCCKVKDLVFAILVAHNQLITLVRMKKYFLHQTDLHLIFNLVDASESFKAAESWTPICLPKFDNSGYLHGHVSYLDPKCDTCLILLTVDRDMFFTLSDCRNRIMERLIRHNCLQAISESLAQHSYSITQVDIPDLRHFMYKSRSTAQYTSPELESPYNTSEERERLYGLYLYLHHRIHSPARPMKILFQVADHETLLGWVTSGFELYAVFGPLVTKQTAIGSINKLLKWIKKEEDRLFILNAPTF